MITRKQRLSYQNYPIQFDTDGYRKNVYYSLGLGSVKVDQESQVASMMAPGGTVATPQSSDVNGPPSGVIGGEDATPAETVADDIPMDVPEGSFIVNAAAAEVAGYKDIKKMIMDAVGVAKRLGVDISTGNDKIGDEEAVDLLVSRGEVYIEPTLAKIIGYDVLEKINNRGKREVARRQQEAEQQQQAPMQEGGFVKKKFADGGEPSAYDVNPDYKLLDYPEAEIPSEYQLMKEVNPTSKQDTQMGDIEFQMDMLRRSGDDPIFREAFADVQKRLPSEYIDLTDMSLAEAERKNTRAVADRLFFEKEKITPDAVEQDRRLDYILGGILDTARREGRGYINRPRIHALGRYDRDTDSIESRRFSQSTDSTDVSATLFHELLHKAHMNLVGVPKSYFVNKETGLTERDENKQTRANILHLDVHRRTYEAYKDEMSPETLVEYIELAETTYGSDRTRAKMRDVITEAGAPEPSEGPTFRDYSNLSPSELKRIADIVFNAVAELPEMKSLDKELKAAAAKRQEKRLRDSSGFVPKN